MRHSLTVRLTHWIGALCLWVLLASGLQIFNAHGWLYRGEASDFPNSIFSLTAVPDAQGQPRGITAVGRFEFDTTGLLGVSGPETQREARGFPAWMTLPPGRDLAAGRRWHFFFGWIFTLNLLVYLLYSLASRHLWRDLVPGRNHLRGLGRTLLDHLRLRIPRGVQAREYNVLQRMTYLGVMLGLLPLAIATGLTLSPGLNARFAAVVDLFGGRQSARTLHFVSAFAIVLFFFTHIFMVAVAGLWNPVRAMITGRDAFDGEADSRGE